MNKKNHIVLCQKYKEELEGLSSPPLPGEFGKRIFEGISQKAWDAWLIEQTKVINELGLKMFEPSAQQTLQQHAEKFLFENAKSIHPDHTK